MRTRIAMISEHASPLASLGGVDIGGQNVYVAHLSENLARLGYQADVFTRRDGTAMPEIYDWQRRSPVPGPYRSEKLRRCR